VVEGLHTASVLRVVANVTLDPGLTSICDEYCAGRSSDLYTGSQPMTGIAADVGASAVCDSLKSMPDASVQHTRAC